VTPSVTVNIVRPNMPQELSSQYSITGAAMKKIVCAAVLPLLLAGAGSATAEDLDLRLAGA